MAKNDFQYGGWNSYTLQCGTIMTLISPGDCTVQCGMWLWDHDSEFNKWHEAALAVASGDLETPTLQFHAFPDSRVSSFF